MNDNTEAKFGNRKIRVATLFSTLAFSLSLQAAEESPAADSIFSFEIGAGAEYDSNITVTDIDTTTGQDDVAATIEAGVTYSKGLSSDTNFSASYNVSQNLHDEFSEFDILTHLVIANLSHDFAGFDAGLSYRFADSSLDQEGFLTFHQISPYYSKFLNDKIFLRADYTYTDKAFDNRSVRDSTVNSVGGDIYYFLDGVQSYFIAGYRFEDEDANASQFSFQGHNFRIRYLRRFEFAGKETRMSLGYDIEDRSYDAITPSIGVERDDNRQGFEANFEYPLSDRLNLVIDYNYGDNSSELPAADFEQNLLGVKLLYRI